MGITITENISPKLLKAQGRSHGSLAELAQYHAKRGESAMKANRTWTDRSSDAVRGLFGEAESSGDTHTITLGGTVEYQEYLELGTTKMAARPIIKPTQEEVAPEFIDDAVKIIKDLFS